MMSGCIVGLMKVRNEDWILGLSARAALRVCDKLVVLDHGSTDRTFEILAEVGAEHRNRVKVMPWHDPVFAEMAMYEHMLGLGREWGGTHFYLVDADEVLAAHMADVVRNTVLSLMPREYQHRIPHHIRHMHRQQDRKSTRLNSSHVKNSY